MLRSMRDLALLPKAHLHVHLESTIRETTLREIGARNDVSVPERGAASGGFRQFAEHNELVRRCLRRPEDFRRIAAEFCADEAGHGTRYAEVSFTAAAHGEPAQLSCVSSRPMAHRRAGWNPLMRSLLVSRIRLRH